MPPINPPSESHALMDRLVVVSTSHLWHAMAHLSTARQVAILSVLKEASIRDQSFDQAALLRDWEDAATLVPKAQRRMKATPRRRSRK